MADSQKSNAGQVFFRRIGGRIVPIRIKPNVNVNIGSQAANQTIPNAGVRTYTRGSYQTKNDKRNQQRRERYAIRKDLQTQQKEAAKWTADRGIFGIKALNPYAIGMSVAAGAGAVAAVAGGVAAVKALGPKLYGPGGFKGVTSQVERITKLRNVVAGKAARASSSARDAFRAARQSEKTAKTVFDFANNADLYKKANFLAADAIVKQKRTAELTRKLTAFKTQTGYRYTKPVVDFWTKNQARFYTGIGLGAAGTTYAANYPREKK